MILVHKNLKFVGTIQASANESTVEEVWTWQINVLHLVYIVKLIFAFKNEMGCFYILLLSLELSQLSKLL